MIDDVYSRYVIVSRRAGIMFMTAASSLVGRAAAEARAKDRIIWRAGKRRSRMSPII
jgi:hypothetical protein